MIKTTLFGILLGCVAIGAASKLDGYTSVALFGLGCGIIGAATLSFLNRRTDF